MKGNVRVVNLRSYRLNEGEVLIKVDRSSVLGNVYKMRGDSDYERNRVCDEYVSYFNKRVKEKGEFRNEVIRIYRMVRDGKDIALGCWCFPKRCHAMYIKEFIEKNLEGSKEPSDSFKYRIIVRNSASEEIIFDDVLDEINARAVAKSLVEECVYAGKGRITEARVIEKETSKCIYKASK